uniref:AlNc14C11G1354 protein n=1 Tax=Albugo laibachii Nc14 TaxID=890382 RepID=F0W2X5_9STRA|nr:AlNc14C11G1354 [Albugo laibachii Nc14]|eukprot:CCA15412.1 AlNc14C11G1354 [Albugo laibachii Nc14]
MFSKGVQLHDEQEIVYSTLMAVSIHLDPHWTKMRGGVQLQDDSILSSLLLFSILKPKGVQIHNENCGLLLHDEYEAVSCHNGKRFIFGC